MRVLRLFRTAPPPQPKGHMLITGGGTQEWLDGVRYFTNLSGGGLARSLAIEADKRGYQVTLLAPKELPRLAGPLPSMVELRPFSSTDDLQARLQKAAAEKKYKWVLPAAAVSDYRPAQIVQGKISSDQESLTVHMVKTPKLIGFLRDWFRPKAVLVGFKLLNGVPARERYDIAMKQLAKNNTDLCVENDISEFGPDERKARVIAREGSEFPLRKGTKDQVAGRILEVVERYRMDLAA